MSFEIMLPFLTPIRSLLEQATVSEIMVNPDSSIWIEEAGAIRPLPELHFDDGALLTSLEVIANRFGKKLDADSPIMNVRLPDGSRLAALIPPVVHPSPLLTIRKFTSRGFTMDDLVDRKMLSEDQGKTLAVAVARGDNLLISGGTGSGKTTLLNVLARFIPDHERILVLEDTSDSYILNPTNFRGCPTRYHRNPIQFSDLLKAALRHRPAPDYRGEIRGNRGPRLSGCLSTPAIAVPCPRSTPTATQDHSSARAIGHAKFSSACHSMMWNKSACARSMRRTRSEA